MLLLLSSIVFSFVFFVQLSDGGVVNPAGGGGGVGRERRVVCVCVNENN